MVPFSNNRDINVFTLTFSERFVSLISYADVKKNFLKLPPDASAETCVGMQRRYDDESKR